MIGAEIRDGVEIHRVPDGVVARVRGGRAPSARTKALAIGGEKGGGERESARERLKVFAPASLVFVVLGARRGDVDARAQRRRPRTGAAAAARPASVAAPASASLGATTERVGLATAARDDEALSVFIVAVLWRRCVCLIGEDEIGRSGVYVCVGGVGESAAEQGMG